MGLWDKLKGEFIDIVEWIEDGQKAEMAHRFERYDNEIKNGAKLVVRESQVAVFINEGQLADIFGPGTHTLSTENLPILSTLKGWKYGFHSPFKAEVYFVSTKQFTNLAWGTPNPISLRDKEFGPLRIGAHGIYSIRVTDAGKFVTGIVGTDGDFTAEKITDQLRGIAVTRFTDALGESQLPFLDMASNLNELSAFCEQHIKPDFEEYGILLTKFLVSSVKLPKNVEEALDKRSSMGIIGDMNKFVQYQTGEALTAAANNPGGGGAAAGMGMGMGFGMANQMMNAMNPQMQQQQYQQPQQQMAPPPIPPAATFFVAVNGQQTGPFDMGTLSQMAASGQLTRDSLVWKQGMPAWTAAAQVAELSSVFGAVPPPLPPVQ
ncbi:MAG: SPFH domain-containing protein [Bacteroidales bacterium]|nr:SPFH domain-containing protein [Bacteroidales bacterium]